MRSNLAKLAYAAAFVLVASYIILTLRGPHGVHALAEKRVQIEEMEKHNAELTREIERDRAHIKGLTDNPVEQDLEIRERLKLVHPGEKVYITGQPEKQEASR